MTARWDMVGQPIATADMAASIPTIYQRFRLPTTFAHQLLQGVGLGIIFHSAIYAAVSVEIWSDQGGLPAQKIATSLTSWTKAQVDALYPLDYKFLYAGFQFTPISLRRGTYYHVVLRATTYTGTAVNHIAWRHSYPDTQYTAGLGFTVEAIKAAVVPLETLIFASEA